MPAIGREIGRDGQQKSKLADVLLHDALEQRATDLHLNPHDGGMRVRLRVDGACTHEHSLVTLEEPVEYHIDGITQTQVDHRHGLSFAAGLPAMLRSDPDYLVLGEIRDSDAASAAREASGHGRIAILAHST